MNLKDITRIRLLSQQITATQFKTVTDIVDWMGAVQAQDYAMSRWAIGARLPGCNEDQVDEAVHNGQVIRTHVLRPTWHLVKATELPWMLALSAPQIKTSMRSRDKELGLTEEIFTKSNKLLSKMLRDDQHLTREEIMEVLTKGKVASAPEQAWHLLARAELDAVICSGRIKAQKQTYALLAERIPDGIMLHKEEALGKLAVKYFSSHGPATLKDFIWWSGLPVGDAKKGLELIKSQLIAETVGPETYYLTPQFATITPGRKTTAYLLPAFDEYLISYKDRTAAIPLTDQEKAFTSNGIFRPIIVVDGEVTGIWKRSVKKDVVQIEAELFKPVNATVQRLLGKQAEAFATFLGKKLKGSLFDQ